MSQTLLPDYYEVLGVAPDASPREIKQAYREAVKRWHPDTHLEDRERATRRMQEINGAYAVLGDSTRRAAYDDKRTRKTEQQEAERRRAEDRELEEHLAQEIREQWQAAAPWYRANGDVDALRLLVVEAFGPHLDRAVHSFGTLGHLLDEIHAEVLEAEREAERREESLANYLRWEWKLAAVQVRLDGGGADALRRSLARVFGPHLERALHGTGGPLVDFYDECDAEVLEAERRTWHPTVRPSSVIDATDRVSNAIPFAEAPVAGDEGGTAWHASEVAASAAMWAPPRPPRRVGSRRVLVFAAGAIALALAGRAAVGYTRRGAGEDARETLAAARPLVEAPAAGVLSGADDRGVLVSELRRLDAAMERARQRGGRWPSRPPTGLTSQPEVRLQVGRVTGGWVGIATSRASGQACEMDVTTQPSGRVRRMLRCAPSALALASRGAR